MNGGLLRKQQQQLRSYAQESTMEILKRLRGETGASLTQCKEAVKQTDGAGFDQALEWLKANTQISATAKALKLESRSAAEGVIAVARNHHNLAAMIELNCETDFVSRNERFSSLANDIASSLLLMPATASTPFQEIDLESLKASKLGSGQKVGEAILECISTVGENVVLRRAILGRNEHGLVGIATHGVSLSNQNNNWMMGRIATLLALDSSKSDEVTLQKLDSLANKVAKHVVGMNPSTISELLEQPFLFTPELTISKLLETEGNKLDTKLSIQSWIRYSCGENVQRKKIDFAQEVQQMLKK